MKQILYKIFFILLRTSLFTFFSKTCSEAICMVRGLHKSKLALIILSVFISSVITSSVFASLQDAINSSKKTYTFNGNETATQNLGELKANLTITGNNYSISGNNTYYGIYVYEGRTLTVSQLTWTNLNNGFGGAIYNNYGTVNLTDVTFSYNNSTVGTVANYYTKIIFNGKAIFTNNTSTSSNSSGAIFNVNGAEITFNGAATFTNNKGAIYNDTGAKITFNNGATFTGNKKGNTLNDIYNGYSSVINFNGGIVTMDGGITGNGTVNINGATNFTLLNNATITGNKLNVGTSAAKWTGSLNINNGLIENLNTTNFYTNNGSLKIDVNLATGASDKFTITGTATGTVKLKLSDINFLNLSDFKGTNGSIDLFTGGNLTGLTISLDNSNFSIAYNKKSLNFTSSNGKINYSLSSNLDLPAQVVATQAKRYYILSNHETYSKDFGSMGGTELTIYGNNKTISNSGTNSGITVTSGKTLNVYDVALTNFKNTSNGGAIYNNEGTIILNNITFKNNVSNNMGGAIYNNSNSKITFNGNTTFSNNTSSLYGGAIENYPGGEIIFNGNTTFSNNTSSTWGGAIENWNNSKITFNDFVTFSGNMLTNGSYGGAISNYNGNSIITFNKGATFTGNKINTSTPNDIYNSNSTLNFNGGTVSMDGGITGSGGTLNINGATDFNLLSNATITDNAVKFGAATAYSGTFDTKGNVTTNFAINSFTGNNATLVLDVNISNSGITGDSFKLANNPTGTVNIKINPLTVNNGTSGSYVFMDKTGSLATAITAESAKFSNGSKEYVFSVTGNTITYIRTDSGLKRALNSNTETSYTLNGTELCNDENGLGSYNEGYSSGKTNFTVTSAGNNYYTVDGGGYSGITVNSGQTLNISKSTWTNFESKTGAVIKNNGGTVNLTDVTFSSNTATEYYGGAIHNSNGGTITLTSSIFYGNKIYVQDTVISGGGAVYNKNSKIIFNGTTVFDSNGGGARNGGAIDNEGGEIIFNGLTKFINNTVSRQQGYTGTVWAASLSSDYDATTTFNKEVIFDNNYSEHDEGGIDIGTRSKVFFKDKATFTNNTAAKSWAAFCSAESALIQFDGTVLVSSNTSLGSYAVAGSYGNSSGLPDYDGTSRINFNGDTTFSYNHIGGIYGAALYLRTTDSEINFNGGTIMFTGNLANYDTATKKGTPSDIYNEGTINFDNNNITADGGINGTTTGILNIKSSNFKLINGAIIENNTVNIKGSTLTINSGATSAANAVEKTAMGTKYNFETNSGKKNELTVSGFQTGLDLTKITGINNISNITVTNNKTAITGNTTSDTINVSTKIINTTVLAQNNITAFKNLTIESSTITVTDTNGNTSNKMLQNVAIKNSSITIQKNNINMINGSPTLTDFISNVNFTGNNELTVSGFKYGLLLSSITDSNIQNFGNVKKINATNNNYGIANFATNQINNKAINANQNVVAGVYNAGNKLSINNSTITINAIQQKMGNFVYGIKNNDGTLQIENSQIDITVSTVTAETNVENYAIYVAKDSSLSIQNSTITMNTLLNNQYATAIYNKGKIKIGSEINETWLWINYDSEDESTHSWNYGISYIMNGTDRKYIQFIGSIVYINGEQITISGYGVSNSSLVYNVSGSSINAVKNKGKIENQTDYKVKEVIISSANGKGGIYNSNILANTVPIKANYNGTSREKIEEEDGTGAGITFVDGNTIKAVSIEANNNRTSGILVESGTNNILNATNIKVNANGEGALNYIDESGKKIDETVLRNGITVMENAGIQITGNIEAKNNKVYGIWIKEKGQMQMNGQITASNNSSYGILLNNSKLLKETGGTLDILVENSSTHGLMVLNGSTLTATSITAKNNPKHGIGIGRSGEYVNEYPGSSSVTVKTITAIDNNIGIVIDTSTVIVEKLIAYNNNNEDLTDYTSQQSSAGEQVHLHIGGKLIAEEVEIINTESGNVNGGLKGVALYTNSNAQISSATIIKNNYGIYTNNSNIEITSTTKHTTAQLILKDNNYAIVSTNSSVMQISNADVEIKETKKIAIGIINNSKLNINKATVTVTNVYNAGKVGTAMNVTNGSTLTINNSNININATKQNAIGTAIIASANSIVNITNNSNVYISSVSNVGMQNINITDSFVKITNVNKVSTGAININKTGKEGLCLEGNYIGLLLTEDRIIEGAYITAKNNEYGIKADEGVTLNLGIKMEISSNTTVGIQGTNKNITLKNIKEMQVAGNTTGLKDVVIDESYGTFTKNGTAINNTHIEDSNLSFSGNTISVLNSNIKESEMNFLTGQTGLAFDDGKAYNIDNTNLSIKQQTKEAIKITNKSTLTMKGLCAGSKLEIIGNKNGINIDSSTGGSLILDKMDVLVSGSNLIRINGIADVYIKDTNIDIDKNYTQFLIVAGNKGNIRLKATNMSYKDYTESRNDYKFLNNSGKTIDLELIESNIVGKITGSENIYPNITLYGSNSWKKIGTSKIKNLEMKEDAGYSYLTFSAKGSQIDKLTITNNLTIKRGALIINLEDLGYTGGVNKYTIIEVSKNNVIGKSAVYAGIMELGAYTYRLSDLENNGYSIIKNSNKNNAAKTVENTPAILNSVVTAGLNSLNRRLGDIRRTPKENLNGVWARVYGRNDKFNKEIETKTEMTGAEGGYDRQIMKDKKDRYYIGAMVGYQNISKIETKQSANVFGNGSGEGYAPSVGAYATWIAENGLFADITIRKFWVSLDMTSYINNKAEKYKPYRTQIAASFEFGKEFGVETSADSKVIIEPKTEWVYSYAGGNGYNLGANRIEYGDTNSIRGKLGIMIGFNTKTQKGLTFEPYIEAGYNYEFNNKTDIVWNGKKEFERDLSGGYGDIGVGFNTYLGKGISGYSLISYEKGSEQENLFYNIGIRYGF